MKAHGTLVIQESWCKGCGICVAFCPRGALTLINDKAVLINEPVCTLCGFCEQLCPDYAIYIESNPDSGELPASDSGNQSASDIGELPVSDCGNQSASDIGERGDSK